MIATVLALVLPCSPLALQTAMLAEPIQAPPNDIRIVRETTNGGGDNPPGMVLIPGGEVTIGTPPDQVETLGQNEQYLMVMIAAETPQRRITVEPFFMDVTEVTNRQWKVYLDATGQSPSEVLVQYGWPGGEIPAGQENLPITNVNFPEIRDFLIWCGKRLPTEEEWVRAARGDDERAYPWGDKFDRKRCQSGMTMPNVPVAVGTYPDGASPFGVLGMAGNVFEWTSSPFREYPGYEPIVVKRGRQKITLTPEFDSTFKVYKGGGFNSGREPLRIDARFGANSADSDAALGFRAARSAQPGLEALRHAYQRLLPPSLTKPQLDETDTFGFEITDYEGSEKVVKGYRYLAFGHRGTERGKGYSKLKKSSIDEPFAVGVFCTSEAMVSPKLPPGEYTIAFKGEGESKAYRAAKRDGNKGDSSLPAGRDPDGAMAPWPGVPSIHDVLNDIDFPQDKEVMLFYNAANAVVGWVPCTEAKDSDRKNIEGTLSSDGKTCEIAFSVDIVNRRVPNFAFEVELETPLK